MNFRSLLSVLALIAVAHATQVMHRPADYKTLLQPYAHVIPDPPHNVTGRSIRGRTFARSVMGKGMISAGYFTNWGVYGRNFQPSDIVTSTLTHILYSFADVDPNSGTILLTDSYADEQKHFPGDSWDEPGNNLYGCLKQMYLLKKAHRNLKVLLSVGGWTYSQSGHFSFVTNPSYRSTFVASAVQKIEDYGFDGIDIDFEYPSGASQGSGFASLMTELRAALDHLASRKGDAVPYQITLAVSAGYANYINLDIPTTDKHISYWNLMAYDYAGSWSTVSDDLANLYGGAISNVSTDKAFKDYIARGATAGKINMGIPLYGRGFEQTAGIRKPYNGVGPGTWEAGVYDYKALPFPGATVVEQSNNVASYSYDSAKKELISYDTPNIVKTKVHYINTNGMAGSMYWSLDSDKKGADSLIGTSVGVLGQLDQTQVRHIFNGADVTTAESIGTFYPGSKWANIANGMNGSAPPSSTSSSSTTAPSPSPTGSCANTAKWDSSAVYTGGQSATYNGHLWTAKWWTQGDVPGGPADAWADKGPC